MALKGHRIIWTENNFLTCESVAEAGQILVYKTSGSGIAIGDSAGLGDVVANPSGYTPAGMLITHAVVSTDETLYHLNYHQDTIKTGGKVHASDRCRVTTNKVIGTPAVGNTAYLTSSGCVEPTAHADGGRVARPPVGKFVSIKDENGYATVEISLPQIP